MDSMDGMNGMGGSNSSGMVMMSIFQTSMATPLYSAAWTPNSVGAYAGTCIFLIVLAVILRGILAYKAIREAKWLDVELQRRYVVVNGKESMAERLSKDSMARPIVLSENGVEENVMVVQRKKAITRPWRITVDPVRACLDVLIAGVGYLL
jgi:Ctr copper transporter family